MGCFDQPLREGGGQGCLQMAQSQGCSPHLHSLAQMGKGTMGGKQPHGVLSQPHDGRGDFQLPALTRRGSLGAHSRGSLRCRGGIVVWSGCQRLDLGLLLQGLQVLKSSEASG